MYYIKMKCQRMVGQCPACSIGRAVAELTTGASSTSHQVQFFFRLPNYFDRKASNSMRNSTVSISSSAPAKASSNPLCIRTHFVHTSIWNTQYLWAKFAIGFRWLHLLVKHFNVLAGALCSGAQLDLIVQFGFAQALTVSIRVSQD